MSNLAEKNTIEKLFYIIRSLSLVLKRGVIDKKTSLRYSKIVTLTFWKENCAISWLNYLVLGLAGETGEVIEIVKKFLNSFDRKKIKNSNLKRKLILELGDVLWYLVSIIIEEKLDFKEIVEINLLKIKRRFLKLLIKRRKLN